MFMLLIALQVITGSYSPTSYFPTMEEAVVDSDKYVVVLTSKEIIDYDNWCVFLSNTGPSAVDLTTECSPDNAHWSTIFWSTQLHPETTSSHCSNDACKYIRTKAKNMTSKPTTIQSWVTAKNKHCNKECECTCNKKEKK